MRIFINDEEQTVGDGATIADLLEQLQLNVAHVAVEKNKELVPRRDHATTSLASDDRLEIVTLVGGG